MIPFLVTKKETLDLIFTIVVNSIFINFEVFKAQIFSDLFYILSFAGRDFPRDQSLVLIQCNKKVIHSFECQVTKRGLHSKELNPILVEHWQDQNALEASLQAYSLMLFNILQLIILPSYSTIQLKIICSVNFFQIFIPETTNTLNE